MLVQLNSLAGVVTIDPGVHTAVAYWTHDRQEPVYTACVTVYELDSASAEFRGIVSWVPQLVSVYIEGVEVHAGSARSMASASRGNLSSLAYLVGALAASIRTVTRPVYIVRPSEWKGQLDDRALRARIVRAGLERPRNPHIAAAIGMGLALRGWL